MYNQNFERVNQVGFKGRKVIESLPLKQRYLEVTQKKLSNPRRSGKVDIINEMIIPLMMRRCWRRLPLLVFFPSICWFGYNFVASRYEIQELDQKCYSGFAKVTDMICYSQTVHEKLLILYLLCISCYFYQVHLFLENSSIFSHYFFSRKFLVLLGQSLIQKDFTV